MLKTKATRKRVNLREDKTSRKARINIWNKIYRRALFERTGIRFPKGKIYEDIATIYPLMLHANRISKVNEPLYYYILKREGAITATFSENILQMYDSQS